MVAQQILVLFVKVRILMRQQKSERANGSLALFIRPDYATLRIMYN